jgi:hypothetical protein
LYSRTPSSVIGRDMLFMVGMFGSAPWSTRSFIATMSLA